MIRLGRHCLDQWFLNMSMPQVESAAGPHTKHFQFRNFGGLKIYISNKLPGNAQVVGLRARFQDDSQRWLHIRSSRNLKNVMPKLDSIQLSKKVG